MKTVALLSMLVADLYIACANFLTKSNEIFRSPVYRGNRNANERDYRGASMLREKRSFLKFCTSHGRPRFLPSDVDDVITKTAVGLSMFVAHPYVAYTNILTKTGEFFR